MSGRTVYAIASGKGGVGKTTTAINLGAMLADRGHDVVIVDTDLGMANLADFLEVDIEPPTLHEVLAGDADTEEAVYPGPGDIDVLPSATDIEAFARSDPTNLDGVVADLRESYDYVLLDTGAGVSYDVLVPLALADGVLLVATPDVASVRDTAKTGELADRVETEVVGAVLAQRSSDILNADDVEETLGTDVLAVIPQDEAVPMGIDAGRPLAAFAPNAPAGQAYRELAEVLIGEADPDPELDLGSDGDVDTAFDVDPPRRADDSGPGAGQSGEGVSERDEGVIDGGSSEGLLGGELASAAEEIRKQAASESDSSAGGWAESADIGNDVAGPFGVGNDEAEPTAGPDQEPGDSRDAEPTDGRDVTEPGDERTAGAPEDDEARSVDDLIDEHMGEDQLDDSSFGDDDPLAGMDDDPLAGMDDDHSEPDEESGDVFDDATETASETPRDAGGRTPDETGGDVSERERPSGRDAAHEADRASDDAGPDFGEPDRANSFEDDDPVLEDDAAGTGPRDGERRDAEADTSGADSGPDRRESTPRQGAGEIPSDTPFSEEDDEDEEKSGVLGRLGSLFK